MTSSRCNNFFRSAGTCFLSVVLLTVELEVIPRLQAATLTANFSPISGGTIDLSAQGILDWAHWGTASTSSFDHKFPVTNLISNFIQLGSNPLEQDNAIGVGYSWTNGTPTSSVAD